MRKLERKLEICPSVSLDGPRAEDFTSTYAGNETLYDSAEGSASQIPNGLKNAAAKGLAVPLQASTSNQDNSYDEAAAGGEGGGPSTSSTPRKPREEGEALEDLDLGEEDGIDQRSSPQDRELNPPSRMLFLDQELYCGVSYESYQKELKPPFKAQKGYKGIGIHPLANNSPRRLAIQFKQRKDATEALNELYGRPLDNANPSYLRLNYVKKPSFSNKPAW